MAFKDKQTKRERLSSIVSGDVRDRNRAGPSMIRLNSAALSPRIGMPVTGLGANIKQPKIQSRVLPTLPRDAPKPPQVIRTTVSERLTPASAQAAAPARMAVNRATGNTTGFTSGKTTGKTVTKAGTAYKTPETAYQRQQRISQEKSGVAGPFRSTGGASRSAGPSRSTGGRISDPSRGGMGNSGRGTGSKK